MAETAITFRNLTIHSMPEAAEGPYRLSAKDDAGLPYLLILRTRCGLQAGERAHFCGILQEKKDRAHRYLLLIEDPAPPIARLKAQFADFADIVSFGEAFDFAERPIASLWMNLELAEPLEARAQSGVTRIQRLSQSHDETLRWIGGILREIKTGNALFAFIDPLAFLPAWAHEPESQPGGADTEMARTAELYAQMRLNQAAARLRAMIPGLSSAPEGEMGGSETPDEMSATLNWGRRQGDDLHRHGHPIPLFGQYESWVTRAQDWAGLSGNGFVPKTHIPPEPRNTLTLAASLGMALAESGALDALQTDEEDGLSPLSLRHSFADCFALLATAQRYGDHPVLREFAGLKQGQLLVSPLYCATGRVLESALQTAQDLLRNNKLAEMGGAELVTLAAKIAQTETLREPERVSLSQQRNKIYQFCDINIEEDHVRDESGGITAYEGIKRALDLEMIPDAPGTQMLAQALKAVETHLHTPIELNRESSRQAAITHYGRDLEETIHALDLQDAQEEAEYAMLVLDHEKQAHAEKRGVTRFMLQVMPFLKADSNLAGARTALLDKNLRGITLAQAWRKPQPCAGDPAGRYYPPSLLALLLDDLGHPPKKRVQDFIEASQAALEAVEAALNNPKKRAAWQRAVLTLRRQQILAFSLLAEQGGGGKIAGVNARQMTALRSAGAGRDVPLPLKALLGQRQRLAEELSQMTGSRIPLGRKTKPMEQDEPS